jgi:hypothetical protein
MSYQQKLTFQLRVRGQSEEEIAEVLREIRSHAPAGDEGYATEFGTPEEYAQRFEKKKRRRPAAVTVGIIVAVIGIVGYIAAGLVMRHLLHSDVGISDVIPSWVISWGSVAFVGIIVFVGLLIDRLRPVRALDLDASR